MSGSKLVLGYWNFRGFGESCRYMLEYCGCDYEDKQIPRKSPNDHSNWREIQDSFGLNFPNLPFLIDGDRTLSESSAILKYLGRKFDLMPVTEDEKIYGDMLEGILLELRGKFYDLFFVPKDKYCESVNEYSNSKFLPKMKRIVSSMRGKKWLVSDKQFDQLEMIPHTPLALKRIKFGKKHSPKILNTSFVFPMTYVDFIFYVNLAQVKTMFPDMLKGFDQLHEYMENFQRLPAIKNYIESQRFQEFPNADPYIKKENICKLT